MKKHFAIKAVPNLIIINIRFNRDLYGTLPYMGDIGLVDGKT